RGRGSRFAVVTRHCTYLICIAACCFAALASASAAAPQPRIYSLKVGDQFDVAGTRIKCKIGTSSGRAPTVMCGLFRPGSGGALTAPYRFSFADPGVAV